MSKINSTKIKKEILAKQQLEKDINECKIFFKTYLTSVKNRSDVLNKLYPLCVKYEKTEPNSTFYIDKERTSLEDKVEKIIKEYFSPRILQLFNKEIPMPILKKKIDFDQSIVLGILSGVTSTYEAINKKYKKEWNYRRDFLIFLYNCLNYFGLHPNILLRDEKTYKRYNFVIEHFFKSKTKIVDYRVLLELENLQEDYINPYEQKLPIKIKGKLIPFKDIHSIQITSTLLLDDEIELYGRKNNFIWNNSTKDELKFISFCHDETETFHKNPYLINDKEKFRNQDIYFVNPIRIKELRKIKNKDFDLTKLIRLCEELNSNSSTMNNYSSSLLVRSIIDHIPPIFGYTNFSSLANNYVDGTRSFKKSMLNLDNSLRNIADNNIHSQVRKKEVLPTTTQVDFTQELDLLLSEIVRKLK